MKNEKKIKSKEKKEILSPYMLNIYMSHPISR